MLQRSKAVFLMAGLTAGFLLGQAAQPPSQPPAASPDETPVFRSDIRLVDLHASVFDKSRKLDSRGGTAMRDAISLSMNYVKENGKRDKKVLIVVTDGNDNSSAETIEQTVRKAQTSEVLIYCIGLLNEEEAREARAAKRALK